MKRTGICTVAFAVFVLTGCGSAPISPSQSSASKPDLVVMIAIDQFSSALFERWRDRYTGGLKRLASEGVVFSNGYQAHGLTETCPGHSTLLTGKSPGRTGIVGNSWYDVDTGKPVYCVSASGYTAAHDPAAREVGPTNLTASTLGDWLKESSSASRVVVVSGKDRASITLGGHKADGVFWYADKAGFTTYVGKGEDAAAKLAPLAALNARIQADYASTPPWIYAHPECRKLEATYQIGDTTWKSTLPPMRPTKVGEKARPVLPLQIMDPLTVEAAEVLMRHYQLGQRGVTDLLAVSLSATDYVGHGYGTQGPEMCEQMYLLDALLDGFMKKLSTFEGKVLVVMTADHGGSDFPERLALQGDKQAKRVDGKAWLQSVNAEVKHMLGLSYDPLVSPDLYQLYVVGADRKHMPEPQRSKVVEAALKVIHGRPEIEAVFSIDELLSHRPVGKEYEQMSLRDRYALSAMRGRSGDLIIAYKQGINPSAPQLTYFIEGHSGPYDIDRRIPIVFWWSSAHGAERKPSVSSTDIAPTLAHIIGVKAPADLDGKCLDIADFGNGACPRR